MFTSIIEKLKSNEAAWAVYRDSFSESFIQARKVLLHEGEVADTIYFIRKGCLRQWFNKDGKDITFQFFFEGQPVASIDSFLNNQPSLFAIESIESSSVIMVSKKVFNELHEKSPEFRLEFEEYFFQRFRNYAQLFLSRIKDSPSERYHDLLKNHPEIIRRIPQHYIASYLGITSVSLSRIRNKK